MVRRNLILTFAALSIGLCASPLVAQDQAEGPQEIPTLNERLEQFRNELIGQPSRAESREAAEQERKRKRAQAMTKQQDAKLAQQAASMLKPLPAANPASTVRTPSHMEVQSARKAQPNRGLLSPKTQGDEEQPAPTRSRVDIDEAVGGVDDPRVARAPSAPVPRQLSPSVDESDAGEGGTGPAAPGVLFTTQSPVLSVEAVGPRTVLVGKEAQFIVKIRNSGAAANNVIVTMNIPSDVDVASAHATAGTVPAAGAGRERGPLEWKINRLVPKSGETLNLVLIPRKSTPLDLGMRWTFTPEASQMLVEVQEPKLEMAIVGPDDVLFGETKIYKLTLSNPGNGDCANVVVGLLPVGRGAEGIASHKVGKLRAGESKTINVELTARQAGTIAIKAQAYADGGLRTEAAEEVLVRRAALQIDVEAPKVKYAGTVGTYRIKVVNSGNAPADGVEVAAMLPPDAKYIASNGGGRFDPQLGKVTWSAGSLQHGAERVFELQCTLATPGDNRMQFAALAADNLSTAATANTQVQALADLKVEVRDPQGPIAVGEDAAYEVVIRNRGSAAADNVEVAVFFSEGLEATSVEGGEHEMAAGQVVFKPIAAVGAGESVVFRVHTKADRGGNHVFRAELVCQSLGTKLAAEEATHFYGNDDAGTPAANNSPGEPHPATPPADDGPGEPHPATPPADSSPGEPRPATPRELPSSDEPPPVPQ
jgi:uncharacterized repeat protein (TIGR01451 family)